MDKLRILICFLLLPFCVFAQQTKGVRFEQSLSWTQLLAKAKSEHKYLFVDCYASWCGPCKEMERSTYTDEEVGKTVNAHFIAVKLQLDKTPHDNDEVKRHYADAKLIGSKYQVNAYPTFLFFDPNGELVHKGVGYLPTGGFIELARAAMEPARQYYTLLAKYQSGQLEVKQKPYLAMTAGGLSENELANKIATDYIAHDLPKLKAYDRETLRFLSAFTGSSDSPGFRYFYQHPEQADSVMQQKNFAENSIDRVVMSEEIDAKVKGNGVPDWKSIKDTITGKYGKVIADRTVTKAVIYQSYGKDWPAFTAALRHYTDTYEDKANLPLLNKNAQYVLQYSKNKAELQAALKWNDLTLAKEPGNKVFTATQAALKAKLTTIN